MLHPGVVSCHIVPAIPERLRPIFYQHRHEGRLLSTVMRCGYECLEDVLSTAIKKRGCIDNSVCFVIERQTEVAKMSLLIADEGSFRECSLSRKRLLALGQNGL